MYNLPCNHLLLPKFIPKYMNFIMNYKYNLNQICKYSSMQTLKCLYNTYYKKVIFITENNLFCQYT